MFFVAVAIAALTYMFAIIGLAIDAHRAGVGILIIDIGYISPIGIVLNGAFVFLLAFARRMSDVFALTTLCHHD